MELKLMPFLVFRKFRVNHETWSPSFWELHQLHQSTKFGYGGGLVLCGQIGSIELEDSQTWLVQYTRILYVCQERRANGRHGASPTTFTEVGAVQGLMAPKVSEFRRVFRDKQINPMSQRRDGELGGPAPGATPDWELVFELPPFAGISYPQESNTDNINSCP